jgi:hypothetical protein
LASVGVAIGLADADEEGVVGMTVVADVLDDDSGGSDVAA